MYYVIVGFLLALTLFFLGGFAERASCLWVRYYRWSFVVRSVSYVYRTAMDRDIGFLCNTTFSHVLLKKKPEEFHCCTNGCYVSLAYPKPLRISFVFIDIT